jgi:beta-barrel assembly-enhancing protease
MVRLEALAIAALMAVSLAAALAEPCDALMLISRKTEVSMGKQVAEEIIDDYGGLCADSATNERVARIGAQIAAVSPRKDVTFSYQVVNSTVINAFSAPGGPVIVTRKLARMMTTDDELAFVLGHETGHITAQHARNLMNRSLITQGVATVLFGGAGAIAQTGLNAAYTLYDRGYSRNQEYQADDYGVKLMQQAGYSPEGAVKALAKLGMDTSKGLNKYLATHPDIPRRIDRIGKIAGIPVDRQQALIKEVQGEGIGSRQ